MTKSNELSIMVEWRHGIDPELVQEAEVFIKEFSEVISAPHQREMPEAIERITIKRVHHA